MEIQGALQVIEHAGPSVGGVGRTFIQRVFVTMQATPQHVSQILTKRSGRLQAVSEQVDWTGNVWMGVTVESSAYESRFDHLRRTGARIKFVALEPLLGALPNLDLTGIDWVITGGESGWGARPMQAEWVRDGQIIALVGHQAVDEHAEKVRSKFEARLGPCLWRMFRAHEEPPRDERGVAVELEDENALPIF